MASNQGVDRIGKPGQPHPALGSKNWIVCSHIDKPQGWHRQNHLEQERCSFHQRSVNVSNPNDARWSREPDSIVGLANNEGTLYIQGFDFHVDFMYVCAGTQEIRDRLVVVFV